MKQKIVQCGHDTQANHRADLTSCPHCNNVMDSDKWSKAATTLILNPLCYKTGCVAIMSECPKCFQESWVHIPYSLFFMYDEFPEIWKSKVSILEKQVKLDALRDWAKSICPKCKNLEDGSVEFHANRNCSIGMGPVKTKCEKFIQYDK